MVPAGAGGLEQDSTDSLERIQNSLGMIGGSTDFPAFKLDYRASYALGTDLVSTSSGSQWLDNNAVTINYDNNTNANYPSFNTPGVNSANPGNYTLNNIGLGIFVRARRRDRRGDRCDHSDGHGGQHRSAEVRPVAARPPQDQ